MPLLAKTVTFYLVERGFVGNVVWAELHRLGVTCTHYSQSLFVGEPLFVRGESGHGFRGRQRRRRLQTHRPRHNYQTTERNS